MGVNAEPTTIADEHLPVTGDYAYGFVASPYGESGGCLPVGLKPIGDSYLESLHSPLRCHDLTGSGFEGLEALVSIGYPVLVWTTLYQDEPNFSPEDAGWWINEHCVVMYACDDSVVYLSDPLAGFTACDRETFKYIYQSCGSYALYAR